MADLPIPFPSKGLSDAGPFGEQEPGTTSDATNVRFKDPTNGRYRGAQRSGMSSYLTNPAQANGSNKISHIVSIPFDQKLLTYSVLANASIETVWSTRNPTTTDTPGAVSDRQSNLYILDGASGVAKFNSEQELLWKASLPVQHPKHVCRALLVDDFDGVYAGVSGGGESVKARLWKFRQLPENKTEQQWEIQTKGYIEQVKRKDSLLYTIQNFTESESAWLVVYRAIDEAEPVEAWRKAIAYPANDLAIGPKDGSVFISSEPNATRGIDPRAKHTTTKSQSWTPKNMPNYGKRIWHWQDAKDLDTLTILPKANSDSDEGGEVLSWFDKSEKGRNLFADAYGLSPFDKGPTYRTLGIGALPSLQFNGLTTAVGPPVVQGNSMVSVAPTSVDRADRESQLSWLPSYKGAQFVWCMVVQVPIEATSRWLASFGNAGRAVITNRDPGTATVARPGSMIVYESGGVGSTSGSTTTASAGPSGLNSFPLGQSVGPHGYAVLTWICDGGVHDVFGSASRSMLRVNGRPADRWQSAAFSSLNPTMLGYGQTTPATISRFAGMIGESVCFSDWDDTSDVQQRLMTMPEYPEAAWAVPVTSTELEQLEGYLAHKWGLSHLLPGGYANSLLQVAGSTANNDTVTLDTTIYTFKTTLTDPPVANEVLIGASEPASMLNLTSAINRTGNPGIDYSSTTLAHPSLFAYAGATAYNATPIYMLHVRSRSTYGPSVATTDTWTAGSWHLITTNTTFSGLGSNYGHYPHPHHLNKNGSLTLGGPPDADNLGTRSSVGDLNSPYGILSKHDPANGNVKWIATSNYNNSGIGVGGVGFGCIVNSAGDIYTHGPVQAAVTGPSINADAYNIRKIVDDGTTFNLSTLSSMLTNPWVALLDTGAGGSATLYYHYPRMAVDKFDNVYIPWNAIVQSIFTVPYTLVVYQRASTSDASIAGVQIAGVNTLPDFPAGMAVAIDVQIPEYEADLVTVASSGIPIETRAQFVYVATQIDVPAQRRTVHKLRLITSTPIAGTPRTKTNLVVSGTALKHFTPAGGFVAIGTPFESGAQFIDSTVLLGKAYFTDGKNCWEYNPKAVPTPTLQLLKATSAGRVPERFKLIFSWRGRLGCARTADSPWNWELAKQGDPKNWDYFPPVFTDQSAVKGNGPRIGVNPDIINAVAPVSNEVLLFGGDSTIYALNGDPAVSNSSINLVTDITGMSFGPSWTKDENGALYFFGSHGGAYTLPPGAQPQLISSRIERRFRDIDFSEYFMRLVWSHRDGGLHVFQMPFGVGGAHLSHFFFEQQTGAWWEDEIGTSVSTDLQPTAAYMLDGDTIDDRVLLIGTEDGQIQKWDQDAFNDGVPFGGSAQAIDSMVDWILTPGDALRMRRFSRFKAVLANEQSGCNAELYSSATPGAWGARKHAWRLEPGQNPPHLARIRGAFVRFRLRNASATQRWAFEALSCDVVDAGLSRVG